MPSNGNAPIFLQRRPLQVYLLREQKSSGRFGIEFSAAKDFVKPDLIVYWVAGNPNITDALPDNAILARLVQFDDIAAARRSREIKRRIRAFQPR